MKLSKKKLVVILVIFVSMFFLDNVGAEQYNNYTKAIVSCGSGLMDKIPSIIPQVVSAAYTIIQIAVPVILVITGTLDLFKGITAQKEDEIKKGQQMFIKRLISAAIIFFVVSIVQLLVSFVAGDEGIMTCANCFINGVKENGSCK